MRYLRTGDTEQENEEQKRTSKGVIDHTQESVYKGTAIARRECTSQQCSLAQLITGYGPTPLNHCELQSEHEDQH